MNYLHKEKYVSLKKEGRSIIMLFLMQGKSLQPIATFRRRK